MCFFCTKPRFGCYAHLMRLLVLMAGLSCCVLLSAAFALWRSTRRRSPERASTPQQRAIAHPRLDLAAGIAPATQSVRSPARRRGLARDPETEAPSSNVARPGRPDWAYYNQDLGDLSDPDLRRPSAGGVLRPVGTVSVPEQE